MTDMESLLDVYLKHHTAVQDEIHFCDTLADKLKAIDVQQETMRKESQKEMSVSEKQKSSDESDLELDFDFSRILSEELDDNIWKKKSGRTEKQANKKQRAGKTKQKLKGERGIEAEERQERDMLKLWPLSEEERAELNYLRHKYRWYIQNSLRLEETSDGFEREKMDRELTVEEKTERRMLLSCGARTEMSWNSEEREMLSSERENQLLQEIERLREQLDQANKKIKNQRKNEAKTREQELLEREKLETEFRGREQAWEKERATMRKKEITQKRRQERMEDRIRKMGKDLEELKQKAELGKKEEPEKRKTFSKALRGWFTNVFRRFRRI